MRATGSPSIYVVPVHEEEHEVDRCDAYFQPPYRDPPMYSSRNGSPPPPYRVQHCIHCSYFMLYLNPVAVLQEKKELNVLS